ncbi:LysE family translocator [Streptomyces sanyensis]|uniref:LysE family translocator n=1 Tax=Streptomyces sanyensis TaxID=568869 RepID=UPI003D76C0AA
MSIAFLLTALAVVVTPGAGVLYTLAAGLSHGRRAGVVAAFGCTLGILPHLAAAATGLAALLHTSAPAYHAVKYLGAGYLLYMAWTMLRDRGAPAVEERGEPRPAARVVVSAVLLNLLNPKPMMFFVAFLPQFVPLGGPGSLGAMLRLGGVFIESPLWIPAASAGGGSEALAERGRDSRFAARADRRPLSTARARSQADAVTCEP